MIVILVVAMSTWMVVFVSGIYVYSAELYLHTNLYIYTYNIHLVRYIIKLRFRLSNMQIRMRDVIFAPGLCSVNSMAFTFAPIASGG